MANRHWTASYGSIPTEINPDEYRSINELTGKAIEKFSSLVAFETFGKQTTYAEIDRLSAALGAYLQKEVGIAKGDRVAVMMPNILAFPIAFLAISRIGGVQVNVNPLYTARELEHQLNDSHAKAMIVFNGSTPTLAEVIDKVGIKTIITAGLGDCTGADIPSPEVDPRLKNTVTLPAAIESGKALTLDPVEQSGDDGLFLQYTGGTTGLSKGASLSHRNLLANIAQFKAIMPDVTRPGQEVVVTAIPLYHIFALMVNFLSYFSVGATNWLVANPRDINGLIDTLKAARPTIFVGVNTLYAGLAAHPRLGEVDWSRLGLACGGGAAVVSSTSDRWAQVTGQFIREGYGLSETSPILTFNPQYIQAFTGTTGLPLPSTDIKLLDEEGNEAEIGQPGEICAKGPQVMSGYWEKPEANADAFTEDGYFRTGDIGVFDEKGFLRIVDRKKDMIIVSGFNVFPNEIEEVASGHAGVAECACIGVPDEKTGEAVMLFVVRAPDAQVTEEDIVAFCRAGLVAYKAPKRIRFIDALPKSPVGKILRRELRTEV